MARELPHGNGHSAGHSHSHSDMPVLPVSHHHSHSSGQPVALRYQLHVLRRRWWLVALVALTVLGGAWWRSRSQVPHYTAELQLQKQPDRGLMESGWAGFYDLTPEAVNAQIQVVQSEPVLSQVIDSVGARLVFTDPAIRRSAVFSSVQVGAHAPQGSYALRVSGDNVELVDAAANRRLASGQRGDLLTGPGFMVRTQPTMTAVEPLLFDIIRADEAFTNLRAGLKVEQLKNTMILAIRYTDADPSFARDVANGVGKSYTWYTGRRARQEATQKRQIIAERLAQLEDSLLIAQRQLRSVDNMAVRSGGAANADALGIELLQTTSRLRTLESRKSQLEDIRAALQRDANEGMQRALAMGEELPAAKTLYENLLQLRQRRRDVLDRQGISENQPEIMRYDTAIAAISSDMQRMVGAQIDQVTASISGVQKRLNELQSDFGLMSGRMAETDALRQGADALQRVYFDLSERYYEAQIGERLEAGTVDVISYARTPNAPDGGRKTRSFFFALVVGLVLGVMAAFVLEQMDTRVRDAEDATRASSVGVIGMIPELRGDASRPLAIKADDHTIGAEAYRKLRTNLRFLRADRPRVIAVTSPSPDEGKSVTAANLALAIAQQGQEVLIIDGDLRRPVQHEIFGVERGAGLSDALVGLVDPFDAITPFDEQPNISVMTCGTEAPNPAELLGSDAFSRLLATLLERFDTIVVDTPPVNLVTDAAVIGSVTDGVLLVAEAGRTDRSVLASAVNELRQARGSVLGIVLNRVSPGGRYGRYGGYYSGRMYYRREQNGSGNGNGDNRITSIKEWVSALI